jgi:hypothetical protein
MLKRYGIDGDINPTDVVMIFLVIIGIAVARERR